MEFLQYFSPPVQEILKESFNIATTQLSYCGIKREGTAYVFSGDYTESCIVNLSDELHPCTCRRYIKLGLACPHIFALIQGSSSWFNLTWKSSNICFNAVVEKLVEWKDLPTNLSAPNHALLDDKIIKDFAVISNAMLDGLVFVPAVSD